MDRLGRHIIRELRNIVPKRGLTHSEGLMIAEIQATSLIRLMRVTTPPIPVPQILAKLDISTSYDPDVLDTGRLEFRPDGGWHIICRDDQPGQRDRIMAYQLKHIFDEADNDLMYPPSELMSATMRQHYVAEYFAMCLALPHELLTQTWHRGQRQVDQLAALFEVAPDTVMFRLKALGMIGPEVGPLSQAPAM